MFEIQKKALGFTIEVKFETVKIQPVHIPLECFIKSKSLINAMTYLANICVNDLNFEDRESYLKNYFEGKGWTIK